MRLTSPVARTTIRAVASFRLCSRAWARRRLAAPRLRRRPGPRGGQRHPEQPQSPKRPRLRAAGAVFPPVVPRRQPQPNSRRRPHPEQPRRDRRIQHPGKLPSMGRQGARANEELAFGPAGLLQDSNTKARLRCFSKSKSNCAGSSRENKSSLIFLKLIAPNLVGRNSRTLHFGMRSG